jgi:hypothetical protein
MRSAPWFRVCALLCAGWFFSPLAGLCDDKPAHSKFTGAYESQPQQDTRDMSSMNLSLGPDGSATVTQTSKAGDTSVLFGHWTDTGGGVTVKFDPIAGVAPAPPMDFQPAHDGLQASTWNHTLWGKDTPPPMKRGYKPKDSYWFTMNR